MTGDEQPSRQDDELSAAARELHHEWDTPALWPRIAAAMREVDEATPVDERRLARRVVVLQRWQAIAAAAILVLAVGAASWSGWRLLRPASVPQDAAAQDRLLNEEALAAIERSEAQYVKAIDDLTRLAAPRLEMPDAPLLVNLRDRLVAIDMAIAECRAEISRNRFNAHLRRQLLFIYQEKRHTLEQIQEYDPDAL